jgi:hypothetical protein
MADTPDDAKIITVRELVERITAESLKYQADHSTRILLQQCLVAIVYLVQIAPVAGEVNKPQVVIPS